MSRWVWCLCLATVAQAQNGYLSYSSGIAPSGVASADLNGDGKPDLVVASFGSNPLTTLLNDGKGGFRSLAPFSLGQLAPRSIITADLNGDHKTDLVVLGTGAIAVAVLLGNGDGTFQAPLP